MATPETLKKLDEKKAMAIKRKEKEEDGGTQLLSLSSQTNAPSTHLLVRTEPVEGAPPRHIDLRPLTANNMKYRERKEDFSADVPDRQYGLLHYTNFEDGTTGAGFDPITTQQYYYDPYRPHQNVLQPLSRAFNNYGQYKQRRFPTSRIKQSQLVVEPIPAEIPSWELIVHPDKLVCFHGKTNFLSQLYPSSFIVDGNEYHSVEHYYQACKLFELIGSEAAQALRSIKDPLKVKNTARELLYRAGINNNKVDEWKASQGMLILRHAMRSKFSLAHEELHNKLMDTGDSLLVQDYDKDTFFAAGLLEGGVREWAKDKEGTILKFPVEMSHDTLKYLPLVGKGKNVLGALAMDIRNSLRAKPNTTDIDKGTEKAKSDHVEQREPQMSPGLASAMSCLAMANDEDDGGESDTSASDKSKENGAVTVTD